MPLQSLLFSLLQNTPVMIVAPSNMPQEVHVHNHEHALVRELYIGGTSDVSASNGHHVVATTDMVLTLQPNQALWAMSPTVAGCAVTVLCIQKGS